MDIVSDVLTKAGFSSDRFKFVLSGSYQPREYCVQYRETDYNFICRLLEEEGIWWYFEQSKDSHVLVMADATAAYKPITGEADVPFVPPSGMAHETEHIFRFRLGQAVRPGAVMLTDFNFKNPKLKLDAKADAGRDPSLEFFDYPGEYIDQSAGSKLAKTRIEEFEGSRIIGVGAEQLLPPRRRQDVQPDRASDRRAERHLPDHRAHPPGQAGHAAGHRPARRAAPASSTGKCTSPCWSPARARTRTSGNWRRASCRSPAGWASATPTAHRELSYWIYHAGQVSSDLANVAAGAGRPA